MKGDIESMYQNWLESRPPSVQALAKEFPIGTEYRTSDESAWVLGYTEQDEVILTCRDPLKCYDTARAASFYVHADCLRESIAKALSHASAAI